MEVKKAPVNDAIMVAVAGLVDDAQSATREASHSDIDFQVNRAGLAPVIQRRKASWLAKRNA